ncbi:hypothetical protein JTB14_022260 [Gonioctena quinquepunctata]|nr:hypothetical protein JTB14_022260 [Gonioctena quinquepunctata]
MKTKGLEKTNSSTSRSLKLISPMRKRGDEESLHPVMSDESIEYVGTFSSYYQKMQQKMMVFGQKDSVPETISTPMVEEQSNSSMYHQEHSEKDEQSIKKENIYKH